MDSSKSWQDELWKACCTNGCTNGEGMITDKVPTPDELYAVVKEGEKINQRYREGVASALLGGGITLIPNDALRDHEYMVSRAVYEAAIRLSANHQTPGVPGECDDAPRSD